MLPFNGIPIECKSCFYWNKEQPIICHISDLGRHIIKTNYNPKLILRLCNRHIRTIHTANFGTKKRVIPLPQYTDENQCCAMWEKFEPKITGRRSS